MNFNAPYWGVAQTGNQ